MTSKLRQKALREELRNNFQSAFTDLKALQDYLLADDFRLTEILCMTASRERGKENDLIEILATFYENFGKHVDFMSWSVRHEVEITDSNDQLFRMGSISTSLIFRYLYTDVGINYLSSIICPFIDEILEQDQENLEINLNGTNKPQTVEKNLNIILNIAENFFNNLYKSIDLIPPNVRLGLYLIKKEVLERYPDMKNVVPSMLFLRFLSPTILEPQSYSIVNKDISQIKIHLLTFIKLFQSIANGVPKANITNLSTVEPIIILFIEKHVIKLQKFCDAITDDIEIQDFIKSNKKSKSQIKKLASLKQVSQYINYEFFPDETKIRMIAKESSSDASDHYGRTDKIEKCIQSISKIKNKIGWTFLKEENNITIHRSKKDHIHIYKIQMFLKYLSTKDVYNTIKSIYLPPKHKYYSYSNKFFTKRIESFDSDHSDVHYRINIPFPFSNRDFVCKAFGRTDSKDLAELYIVPIKRSDTPKERGIVRGSLELGYFIKREEVNDIEGTTIEGIIILDSRGSLPKWGTEKIVNTLLSSIQEGVGKIEVKEKPANNSKSEGKISPPNISPTRRSRSSNKRMKDADSTRNIPVYNMDEEIPSSNVIKPIIVRSPMMKSKTTLDIPNSKDEPIGSSPKKNRVSENSKYGESRQISPKRKKKSKVSFDI